MPNKAAPYQEGKPGPNCSGQGLAGYSSTQGARGWWSASNPGWPWPNYQLLSQLLHPAWPKKKGKNHPGNSIWSRNLQGPWVPGSHAGGGGGQGMQRVGAQGEGLQGEERRNCSWGSQPGRAHGRAARKLGPGGHAPWGSGSGSGASAEGKDAGSQALGPRGGLCGDRERGPETGPFKSVSPSAGPPTPNHHIQNSWAEPAGLLGPGMGVGAQKGGLPPSLNTASQHLPPPTEQH